MTGGMGAYSPTPVVTEDDAPQIERDMLVPVVDGLVREGIDYKGVLYAGLMLTTNGPKVLEFNCRFGDPETQPLMMRLKSDLLEVMLAVAEGRLDQIDAEVGPAAGAVRRRDRARDIPANTRPACRSPASTKPTRCPT